MFLLIDAGNSRLKYGLHDKQRWLSQGDTSLLQPDFNLPADFEPARIIVSNVAGAETGNRIQQALSRFAARVEWFRASAQRCGLINDYEQPDTLGADRWAAAIAAWKHLHSACIVVSCGTATTIDLINDQGHFTGGCILPGLDTMLESLARKTAGLPLSTGTLILPPRNTHDAIATGCLLAQSGAIEHMARQLGPDASLLLTGGNAVRIHPHLQVKASIKQGLVLEGLLNVAREARST